MAIEFRTGEPLADEVLARRARLPRKPEPVALTGRIVQLRPLELARDVEDLHAVSDGRPIVQGERSVDAYDPDTLIWRYMAGGPFATAGDLAGWLQGLVEAPDALCLCVCDAATGRPIGSASYLSNSPEHLKVELGTIWYSPIAQRTGANTEATYLMLRHAFELGYRRVEWKCDSLNERSRRAALRMGFVFEGIQESHYIVKGRNRDTAWFRILDREWPEVKARLEALLDATPPA